MKVVTPYGVAETWSEAHELLEKHGVKANEENFRPVQIELEVWSRGATKLERMKTAGEVAKELNGILRKYYPDLYDKLDNGFSALLLQDRQVSIPREWHWLAVYAVRGSSEGHYIHVDIIKNDDSRVLFLLAKTFFGREAAYDIAKVIAEVLDV